MNKGWISQTWTLHLHTHSHIYTEILLSSNWRRTSNQFANTYTYTHTRLQAHVSVVPDKHVCVDAAVVQVTGNTLLNLPKASPCSLCGCVNAPCVCTNIVCVWGKGLLVKWRKYSKEAAAEMPRPSRLTLGAKQDVPCCRNPSLTLSLFWSLSLSLSRSLALFLLRRHHLPVCSRTYPYSNLSFVTLRD